MNGMHTLTAWWRQAPDSRGYGRRQTDAVTAAAGLGVVIVCGALVAGRVITATDVAVFHLQHLVGAGQLRRRQAVQVVFDQEQLKVCVITGGHRRAASGSPVAAPATVAVMSAIPQSIR
jgi:hypothetical protein